MVEWVVLLVALVALGLSIAAVAKPCKSDFADVCKTVYAKPGGYDSCGKYEGKSCDPNDQFSCGYSPVCKCGDGIGGGSEPTDCEVGGRVCCNDSEDCPTGVGPHGEKIPVNCDFSNGCSACPNQFRGVCSDGTSPCQSKEGDDCGTTEKCCHGLTCSPAGFCVKTSPIKPGHLPGDDGCVKQPCNSNKDCSGYNCGPCIMGMCTSKTTTKSGGGRGLPPLNNIGGGHGSTYNPDSSSNGDGGTPSPPSSPSPGGGGGKKSSDLPLILGITCGSVLLLLVVVLVYLIVTKRLKL